MEWKEVIENLKYLISEDCTDTQFDYQDEIKIAIRVMESQEDLRSKIDKAIEEITNLNRYQEGIDTMNVGDDLMISWCKTLEILKRNIGE